MPHSSRNEGRVSGLRLKQAFESLGKVLGRSIADLLDYDLWRQGIRLDKEEYYIPDHIQQVFETFGKDGASLIAEKLRKVLE